MRTPHMNENVVTCHDELRSQDLGHCNLPAITAAYKSCVSSGNTDADGQAALLQDDMAAFKRILERNGPMVPLSSSARFLQNGNPLQGMMFIRTAQRHSM